MSELDERFWQYVVKTDTCWNWVGRCYWDGYGVFATKETGKRKEWRAHRYLYRWAIGPIPPGLYILHRCDNRRCVNPAHLYAGDRWQNARDAVARGRQVRGERQGGAKLTEQAVREIRARRARGETLLSIGRSFGIYESTVHNVCTRKRWAHVQ